jgi:hypothetical protein
VPQNQACPRRAQVRFRLGDGHICCLNPHVKRFILCCCLSTALWSGVAQTNVNEQLLREQQNYVAWTVRFLSSDFWISYNSTLSTRLTDDECRKLDGEYRLARSKYRVLTNAVARRQLIVGILSQVRGADKLLAPASETNVFRRLYRPFLHLSKFELLQSLPNGDAIIQDTAESPNTYYVYDLGRAVDGKMYSNAHLVCEDLKTYQTPMGTSKTVKAYTNVRLNEEENALLLRAQEAFKRRSLELTKTINELSKAAN